MALPGRAIQINQEHLALLGRVIQINQENGFAWEGHPNQLGKLSLGGGGGSNTRHRLEKGCGIILTWCLQEAWVPHSLWVNNFKPQRVAEWVRCCVQHFGWVCAGFICVLQYILLGFLWVPQFLQWVPVGLFWVPRLRVAICSGFLLGSCWVPVFLQQISLGSPWVPLGFLLGSAAFCRNLQWVPLGFLLGSASSSSFILNWRMLK